MAVGSIVKRGNGYAVIIELPRDPKTGKRRQRWLRAPNRKAAEKLARDTIAEIESGEYVEPVKTTVAEFLAQWHASCSGEWAERTIVGYETHIRLRVTPAIGSVPLQKLTPMQIHAFYGELRAQGLSPATIQNLHGMLRNAFRRAVRWGVLKRSPCDMVDPPAAPKSPAQAWTAEQATQFIRETWDHPYGMLFAVAIYTGLRRGELVGLRWQDIDLDERILSVRGQSPKQINGIWVWQALKTESSEREVPLRAAAVSALREQRRRQNARRLTLGPEWADLDVVFDRFDGAPHKPNAVTAAWTAAVERSTLPRIRLHDTRHTAATLMLEAGIPINIVAKILGHTTATMTERYGHITPRALRDFVDTMDRLG